MDQRSVWQGVSKEAVAGARNSTRLQYGTILETRWPSKKFKSSRRFVYVQFTSPVSFRPDTALSYLLNKAFTGTRSSCTRTARL